MKLVIDIGSNTIKCLLAKVDEFGNIQKLFEHSLESRISAGGGILVENASTLISNSIEVLMEKAKTYCNNFQSIAVATSALRDASNKDDIIADVLEKTSVAINVLSGYEEARLSYLGACSDNAIEASVKIENEDDRAIGIMVERLGDLVSIRISNNYVGEVNIRQDGRIPTSKSDTTHHGYGISSMEYTAKKYGGRICMGTDRGVFILQIILPINN